MTTVVIVVILFFVMCILSNRSNMMDVETNNKIPHKAKSKLAKIREELDEFSGNFSNSFVYEPIKDRIVSILSKSPDVETNSLSPRKISYTMIANLCNAIFIRHRMYPRDNDEQELIDIWKLAVEKLYEYGEITDEEYQTTKIHIETTVRSTIDNHKSAFNDDMDDIINNPLNTGKWWF